MTFRTPINCSTDNIDALAQTLADDMASAFNDVMNLVTDTEQFIGSESIGSDIAAGNELLQDLLSTGGPQSNIRYLDEIPALTGIDGGDTQEEDERRIFDTTSLVLTTGLVYLQDPTSSNIETLRRIYFAVGKDLAKAELEIKSTQDTSYRYRLVYRALPAYNSSRSYTLSEVRQILNDQTIIRKDYVILEDRSILLARRVPLGLPDITNAEVAQRYNQNLSEVTSSIFHKTTPKNTSSAINKWLQLGFEEQLPAILDGEDYSMESNTLRERFDKIRSDTSRVMIELEFYKQRLGAIDTNGTKNRFINLIKKLQDDLSRLYSDFLFEVSIVQDSNIIANLRLKLSDREIIHLLENQRYVKGMKIDSSDEEVANAISLASSVAPGDTISSSAILNTTPSVQDLNYATMLYSIADVNRALNTISVGEFNANTITATISELEKFTARSIVTEVQPTSPVAGFPSMTTPNSILLSTIRYDRSFRIDLKLGAIDKALEDLKNLYDRTIAKALTKLLKAAADTVRRAIAMINQVRDRILSQILPLRRQLDQFISKYLTLIGSGDFNSSLMKCAVDFDIGLTTGILDALESLINSLADKLTQLIGRLTAIFLEAVENILCTALAFIDKILGTANSYLPSFCSINAPVLLPAEAIAALNNLRSIAALQNLVIIGYNSDLVRLRAIVITAPDRLDQFKDAANCLNQPITTMLSTTLKNFQFRRTVPGIPL